ncbi:MAG: hypothetical protein HY854_20210 [Burkholderiales bacterium]|nr:hypothetical protein [Burkholderiales bacterium]
MRLLSPGILLACLSLALASCATAPETATFQGNKVPTISGFSMSCTVPYVLTQNCSPSGGASLKVQIRDQVARIAGTADGRTVIVMTDAAIPTQAKAEQAAEAVGAVVETTGARLLKMEALAVMGAGVLGYVLHFDRDVYTSLRRFAMPS